MEKKKGKSFQELAVAAGIKEEAMGRLVEAEFDSLDAIKSMDMTDLTELKLSPGQKALLRAWKESLVTKKKPSHKVDDQSFTMPKPLSCREKVTTRDLAAQMKELDDEAVGLEAILGDEHRAPADSRVRNGKPLLIVDHVISCTRSTDEDGEQEVAPGLFFKAGRSKPKLETVSVSQWAAANAAIMTKLTDSGELRTREDMVGYLRYTQHVADLIQIHTLHSVLLYDNAYRKQQWEHNSSWMETDVHLALKFLDRRVQKPKSHNQNPRSSDMRRRERKDICFDYNNRVGCSRDNCRYKHVCLQDGCGERHPQCNHHQQTSASAGGPLQG